MSALTRTLIEYYRCPANFFDVELTGELSAEAGFFQFGPGVLAYGRSTNGRRSRVVELDLYDTFADVKESGSRLRLPFNPAEIVDTLRREEYPGARDSRIRASKKKAYYRLRPLLHRSLRERIQKFQLKGWQECNFPGWPVDFTVESIHERLLSLMLHCSGAKRVPFIWFWPDGKEACVSITHDVEGPAGKDYCDELMDIDESYGIKASFQLVPEGSYQIPPEFLKTIRQRGFELGLQDLNHDGRLYDDRKEFLRRARLINRYAAQYGASGFRAAVLYRKPEWFDAFEFSFDMSIPNTARLDPQRGGCCTVMPFFIGKILELPVTTIQDYMLFNLLGEESIELWKQQTNAISARNGLISFIVHPDYIMDGTRSRYKELLTYLKAPRASKPLWFGLPSEIDRWWRQRSKMRLAPNGDEWRIEGEGSERAVVAYARNDDGTLRYELQRLAHSSLR